MFSNMHFTNIEYIICLHVTNPYVINRKLETSHLFIIKNNHNHITIISQLVLKCNTVCEEWYYTLLHTSFVSLFFFTEVVNLPLPAHTDYFFPTQVVFHSWFNKYHWRA